MCKIKINQLIKIKISATGKGIKKKEQWRHLNYLVIRRRSKKLGDPRRRGIDGDLDDLDDRERLVLLL